MTADNHRSTGTPNGQMASILLEELKAVYKDFDYETISIEFSKNEQKACLANWLRIAQEA